MFLVVNVLQVFVFNKWNLPFELIVATFIVLVLLFTYRGGIKTIIWTDTLQTTFMLLSLFLSIYYISKDLRIDITSLIYDVFKSDYAKVLVIDWHDERFFLKQFLSGIFICVAMTGLD